MPRRVRPESADRKLADVEVVEYVPIAAKVLGTGQEKPTEPNKETVPGPPERPLHDGKIEEFMREQHRSMGEDGKLHHENSM